MNMKGFAISAKTLYMMFVLVVGILVFIGFTNAYSKLLATKCWKDTLDELDKVKDNINKDKASSSQLILRSSCLDKVVFESRDAYNKCWGFCKETDSGEIDSCLDNCRNCANSKGCIIAVPNIPSKWNYFKVWKAWETYEMRLHVVKALNTKHAVYGSMIESPGEGSNAGCVSLTKQGDDFYAEWKEGAC